MDRNDYIEIRRILETDYPQSVSTYDFIMQDPIGSDIIYNLIEQATRIVYFEALEKYEECDKLHREAIDYLFTFDFEIPSEIENTKKKKETLQTIFKVAIINNRKRYKMMTP